MIKRLIVENYKSIETLDVEFGRVTAFVGSNSSGKSNIVDALRFLRDAVRLGLDRAISDRHGIDSIRRWSPKKPYQIKISVEFEGIGYSEEEFSGEYGLVIGSSKSEGTFSVLSEHGNFLSYDYISEEEGSDEISFENARIYFDRKSDGRISGSFNRNIIGSKDTELESDEIFLSSLIGRIAFEQICDLLYNLEVYSVYPNTLRQPETPSNDPILSSHGGNFCSVFKRLRKSAAGKRRVRDITDAMRLILGNLDEIRIQSVGGYLTPMFRVKEDNEAGHDFNVSQISDGTLRVLGLLLALYQSPRPDIIALEEPELTVNPGVLRMLVESIREASEASQIILTTHSPELVDMLNPEEVRAVELEGGKTIVNPVAQSQLRAVKENLFTLGQIMVSEGISG